MTKMSAKKKANAARSGSAFSSVFHIIDMRGFIIRYLKIVIVLIRMLIAAVYVIITHRYASSSMFS